MNLQPQTTFDHRSTGRLSQLLRSRSYRRLTILVVLLNLISFIAPLFVGTAYATHAGTFAGLIGGFEIDGNYAFDALPGATKDWANVSSPVVVSDRTSLDPAGDDIFTQGSKEEDPGGPSGWAYNDSGSAPGKDDLTKIFFAARLVPATDAFLWLGFERLDVEGNGSASVNFEMNQSSNSLTNGGGTLIPERLPGDLLIAYDYDGGTDPTDVTVDVFQWSGTPTSGSWGSALALVTGTTLGDINTTSTVRPGGVFGTGSVDAKRFGEAGVNLLALYPTYFNTCRSFTSFWAKSRASGSATGSALKDKTPRANINFSTCDAKISIGDSGVNEVGVTHTVTGHVDVKPGQTFENAPTGTVINFSKSGPGTLSASSCTTTDSSGSCSVTLDSSSAGVTTVNATSTVLVAGSPLTRATNGASGNSGPLTKRWVDGLVQIGPSGVNEAGQPHAFVVTATAVPSGTTPSFAISTSVSPAPNGGTSTTCAAPAGTGNTRTCTFTITDSGVGTFTANATATITFTSGQGNATIVRSTAANAGTGGSGPATKRYVDAFIQISPNAVNKVGDSHLFQVTFTALPGTATPVSFGAITPWVAPTPDSAVSNCDTPVIVGNVATCTLIINGTQAETYTANVTGTVTIGGVTLVRLTDGYAGPGGSGPATKHYVNASVAIGPSGINNVGDPHTFKVTVTAQPGTTGPPSFDSIDVSISPTPTSQSTTCASPLVNGNVATCTITINSSLPGTFTANVSAAVTMGGVTVQRSTTGNSGPVGSGPAIKDYIDIDLTKTGPALAHVGDTVTYTMVATNPSSLPLSNVTLTDALCDSAVTLVSGDTNTDQALDPGESWTFRCTHVVTSGDGDPVTNTATVTGTNSGRVAIASANHVVDIIHPAIGITKTANPVSVDTSGTVTFTYVITNTGDTDLFAVVVTDDILGPIGTVPTLTVGASTTMTKTVAVDASSPTRNVATATGADILGLSVSASDDATISVVLPARFERTLPKTGVDAFLLLVLALALINMGLIALWVDPSPS